MFNPFVYRNLICTVLILFTLFFTSCQKSNEVDGAIDLDRSNPVQVFNDVTLYQLYCDHFDELDLNTKLYAHYLVKACVILDAVARDQRNKHHSLISKLIKTVELNKAQHSPDFIEWFESIKFNYWKHNILYFYSTDSSDENPKDLLHFETMMRIFQNSNLNIEINEINVLKSAFKQRASIINNITANEKTDFNTSNFYADELTPQDALEFESSHPQNTRLLKSGGVLFEEIYRAGTPDIAPGRLASVLQNAVVELENALNIAETSSKPALIELIHYLRSGNGAHFDKHLELLKNDKANVAYRIGFYGISDDSLKLRGTMAGGVFVRREDSDWDAITLTGFWGPYVIDFSLFRGMDPIGLMVSNVSGKVVINAIPTPEFSRMGAIRNVFLKYPRDWTSQVY